WAIPADRFSVRWTRQLSLPAGNYRFTVRADDGVRLWVNNHLLVDAWKDQAATYTVDLYLPGGAAPVKMEYYENAGAALAQLTWAPAGGATPPPPEQAWRGEYFNNPWLSGPAALVRDDAEINFNWGNGSPASWAIPADRFSVRWTRQLSLPAGNYRFTVRADDGVRLWVNSQLVIDAWKDQVAAYTVDLYLPGGAAPVKMEYYENAGGALAQLTWAPAGGATPPPPTGAVIVDDRDAGFTKGGLATSWRTVSEGYGGGLVWTRNNDWQRPNYNWARWYPTLRAGRYEVFVYIPDRYSTTSRASYWVSHADGFTLRVVDQSANSNRWVSLGTYRFQGNRNDYVSLADVTYETYLSRLIAFDAVKWEPR
ncbi:MAG: hypothetical protein GX605_08685, partial [Chloroflexi bacterium]|nr:hypothetical protein [Chloroflexota bacterium]